MIETKDVIAFFDRLAGCWDKSIIRNDDVINKILDNAGAREGKYILDVASGTGVLIPVDGPLQELGKLFGGKFHINFPLNFAKIRFFSYLCTCDEIEDDGSPIFSIWNMDKNEIIRAVEPAVSERGCFLVGVTVSGDNDIEIVIDRLVVRPDIQQRLTD